MAIEEFHARSETYAVTFYTNRQFSFSAALVAQRGLDFEYARIGVDPEYRRIYFSFQNTPAPGVVRFHKSGRFRSRMMAIGALCAKYDWLDALRAMKEQSDRQFVLEDVDPNDSEVYQRFQYHITVGYTFSSNKNFGDKRNYPTKAGVYRLKKGGEIVKIGEASNIAVRLKEHLRDYRGQVDVFDFEIVPNATERKAEQKRLLESFKASIGRLPKLNIVTN